MPWREGDPPQSGISSSPNLGGLTPSRDRLGSQDSLQEPSAGESELSFDVSKLRSLM